jgi:hypothetical protein
MKTVVSDVSLATLLQAFFLERLIAQRNAINHHVAGTDALTLSIIPEGS